MNGATFRVTTWEWVQQLGHPRQRERIRVAHIVAVALQSEADSADEF